MFACVFPDHHGYKPHSAALCRSGKAEPRFVCESRFSAVATLIKAHKSVGIRDFCSSAFRMLEFFRPHFAEIEIFFVSDQFAEHRRRVFRAGILRLFRQPRTVGKQRIFHAERSGSFVHRRHKRRFASFHAFRHRHAGIVRRTHRDTFEKFAHLIFSARFQKHLRSAHFRCFFADDYGFVHGKIARFYRVET